MLHRPVESAVDSGRWINAPAVCARRISSSPYNLNKLFRMLQMNNCDHVYVRFTSKVSEPFLCRGAVGRSPDAGNRVQLSLNGKTDARFPPTGE